MGLRPQFEATRSALAPHGITLTIHNHAWEYELLDGRMKIDWLLDFAPELQFELDTYWAANFGANDPAQQVRRFADRCPLLHIKDGPLVKDQPMVAVGSGRMNMKEVIPAANDTTKWLVVELDRSATDMMTCVADSYTYLTSEGLARGNK